MPERIARPCRVRSCGRRTVLDHGYCEQHSDRQRVRPASGWSRWQQGSSSQRGYGHAWTRLREQVLRRDGGLCQQCQREGRYTRASCVDHIRPKSQGGDDAFDNLQSLCDTCHRAKTQTESSRPCHQLATALAARGIQL